MVSSSICMFVYVYAHDLLNRYHTHPRYLPYPSKHVSIRGIEEEKYSVVDVTRVGKPNGVAYILEEIELSRALFEIYEGAVVRVLNACAEMNTFSYPQPCIVHTSRLNFPCQFITVASIHHHLPTSDRVIGSRSQS